ncbi:hypothetical protein ABZS59_34340 [Streptomyces flaveolus]|uniref:hypothetical protein n=1 Tax=Streptomyces flaveolus TaxID=67297 RepID=UPI0033A22DA0
MFKWWDVRPDAERQQWTLDPFVAVGPLRFGMSPAAVSEAVRTGTPDVQRTTVEEPADSAVSGVVAGDFPVLGVRVYYRCERLAGVVVDALRGPQVTAAGEPLVGRVPSEVEGWMLDRAEACEPVAELVYMDAGVPGSASLGVVIDVQRAGDHLLTRPVFVPREAMDDLPHWLPRAAWSAC